MKEKKLLLEPLSSFVSDLHSDTIFGHFCWGLRFTKGEKYLENFLSSFHVSDINKEPPIIFSNGFPDGFLPHPILPVLPSEKMENMHNESIVRDVLSRIIDNIKMNNTLIDDSNLDDICFSRVLKYLGEQKYINTNIFRDLISGIDQYLFLKSQFNTMKFLLESDDIKDDIFHSIVPPTDTGETNLYARVRFISTKGEDNNDLYSIRERFYGKNYRIAIYIKYSECEYLDFNIISDVFDFISNVSGFGKKKSSGKGWFKVNDYYESDLPHCDLNHANAIMSISNFIPDPCLPSSHGKCFYELFTKYPKLYSPRLLNKNDTTPFKKPIVMMHAGSVFILDDIPSEYYGVLLDGIHPDCNLIKVNQGTFLYPLYLKINNTNL